MNSGSSDIKTFAHSIGQNWYHIVMVPKYRYPVFKFPLQRRLALEGIDWVCSKHGIDIYAKEVMEDHAHIFVACPPDCSIRQLVKLIKGGTSYQRA